LQRVGFDCLKGWGMTRSRTAMAHERDRTSKQALETVSVVPARDRW
jgi:hypothetical protein